MIQKYPVGIQDFGKIRQESYPYIDKTEFVYGLAKWGGYYFLSRPRRFGKSLLISTLDCLYKSKKELFEGTFIYDKWDWNEEFPVIRISFANIDHKGKGLPLAIKDSLIKIADFYQVSLKATTIASLFRELIENLHAKYDKQVVVLIDEYDKPIIDFLGTDIQTALENQATMKSFYSILKDADPHLKLVFITGISKFSRVSIFLDLNNLTDISLETEFAGICGITAEELQANFTEELKKTDTKLLKDWYNGYTWDLETWVYNPYSILSFFRKNKFKNFWFETGTPTFLVELSKKEQLFDVEQIEAFENQLNAFQIEHLQSIPIMFQTGYLTFKKQNALTGIYTLDYPNREVKQSYLEMLVNVYSSEPSTSGAVIAGNILAALQKKDFKSLQESINILFKSIPYAHWVSTNEHFYHALVHLIFKLIGVFVQSEVHSSDGHLDSLVLLDEGIFCFEFKLDKSAEIALNQVKDKGYLTPYLQSKKPCYAIGVNFSSEKKRVEEMLWEEVK